MQLHSTKHVDFQPDTGHHFFLYRTSHLWRYQIIIPEWRKEDVLALLVIDKLAVEINGEDTISPG